MSVLLADPSFSQRSRYCHDALFVCLYRVYCDKTAKPTAMPFSLKSIAMPREFVRMDSLPSIERESQLG